MPNMKLKVKTRWRIARSKHYFHTLYADFKGWCKVLLILNVLDWFSTIWFMNLGYKEGNPIQAWIISKSLIISSILKLGLPLLILIWFNYLYTGINEYSGKYKKIAYSIAHLYRGSMIGMVIIYLYVVQKNFTCVIIHYIQ